MRNKDRDMSSTEPRHDPNWSGNIRPDSGRDDRMRNREDDYSPNIDEEEEDDLQERQREGNLGNERVRNSER